LKYNFFKYTSAVALADYFSKRHSGQFEHEVTNTEWKFADVLTDREYFDTFYGSRKTIHFGFSRKEIKMIKFKLQQLLKREAFELSSNSLDIAVRNSCQKCGCKEFLWVDFEEIIKYPPDPPKKDLYWDLMDEFYSDSIEVVKIR